MYLEPIRKNLVRLVVGISIATFIGCAAPPPDPQAIITESIEVHGGDLFRQATVEFDFRDRHFKTYLTNEGRVFERWFADTLGAIHDVMTPTEIYRERDGERVEISEDLRGSIERGLNSVIYFAFLPYRLNDPSVQKRYLGESIIKGRPYHEIEVTFRQEGGGQDWEDRFVYWIHQETKTMDYLAYRFHIDGGGIRFRESHNIRDVNGLRFADNVNFTYRDVSIPIETMDDLFKLGTLEKLSDINLRNIDVRFED